MGKRSILRVAVCLLLCFSAAGLGGYFTSAEIPTWYATLTKPSWTPPGWVFPIVWNVLYFLMAVALWLLWDKSADVDASIPAQAKPGKIGARRVAIGAFLVQLALNAAWSPVFFGAHRIGAALAILVALIAAVVVTIVAAARVNRLAAWLLAPYLVWIAYASTLNAGILMLN